MSIKLFKDIIEDLESNDIINDSNRNEIKTLVRTYVTGLDKIPSLEIALEYVNDKLLSKKINVDNTFSDILNGTSKMTFEDILNSPAYKKRAENKSRTTMPTNPLNDLFNQLGINKK